MRAASLAVLPLLLSGCSGSGGGGGGGPSDGEGQDTVQVEAPSWDVGDWWNYTSPQSGPYTFAITAEQGADWMMETDNQGIAFYNARFDVSNQGPIRKSDLAGSQGSTRVEYFHWPLADQDTWTMDLDGQAITVTATDNQDGTWSFEGRNATGLYVHYVYDTEAEWFSTITFHAPDGSVQYSSELSDHGHNYTGQVDRWTLEEVVSEEGDLSQANKNGNVEVPLTVTDVWAAVHVVCGAGSAIVGIAPFPVVTGLVGTEDRGAGTDSPQCPMEVHFEGVAGAPKAPPQGGETETWTYGTIGSSATTGTYSLEVLLRTLETVSPFAAA